MDLLKNAVKSSIAANVKNVTRMVAALAGFNADITKAFVNATIAEVRDGASGYLPMLPVTIAGGPVNDKGVQSKKDAYTPCAQDVADKANAHALLVTVAVLSSISKHKDILGFYSHDENRVAITMPVQDVPKVDAKLKARIAAAWNDTVTPGQSTGGFGVDLALSL